MNFLDVRHLSVSFTQEQGSVQAVRDVSFSIDEGETLAVVGESGAGKSQVFHALLGLQAKNARVAGSAKLAGQELIGLPATQLNQYRGNALRIIFQDPMTALNPYLKIGVQLTEILQVHQGASYQQARTQALQALQEVKLPNPEWNFQQYPHELSGGMRQRVMIAMAILGHPRLIIADEPTTALDVTVQSDIISLLKKIHQQHGTSMVLITHDIPLVAGLCERIMMMYAGKIVETGTLQEIHQQARHPYTRALLQATPANQRNSGKLVSIAGQPPDPRQLPTGCAFAPRCEKARRQCQTAQPELTAVSDTQQVACFFAEEN